MHTKIQCLNSTGYEPAKKNFFSSLHSCNLGIQLRSPKFVYIYVQSSVTVEGYCSVSVFCLVCTHPLIKCIHFSPTYVSLSPPPPTPPPPPTTLGNVQRYTHCTKHGRSKLSFSFSANVCNYIFIIYIMWLVSIICYKTPQLSSCKAWKISHRLPPWKSQGL